MTAYLYEDHLESERLVTHKLVSADAEAWSVFFEDSDCVKFLPDYQIPDPVDRARHWIDRQINRYTNNNFGLQKLSDKRSGEFIGMCGLIRQKVDGVNELEVGYHLFKKHWGKGYALEAASLFKNYALENKLTPSVISIIHVDNTRSQNVAIKNGLVREKRSTWNNMDAYIYRTPK